MNPGRRGRKESKRDFYGRYFPLAQEWFNNDYFRLLSPSAKNVFLAAIMQYNGDNNGDISLPLSYLRTWCCSGNRQRSAAIAELVNAGWLKRTRHGGLRMGPDLYAVTVKPIDSCVNKRTGRSKHETTPGNGFLHLWKPERAYLREKMQPKRRTDAHPKTRFNGGETTTLRVSAGGVPPVLRVSAGGTPQ